MDSDGATLEAPFLSIEGLTKHYGGSAAVTDFGLTVRKGEFISLLGPSGCGKSTTLGMIAGFVEPTAGSITLEGRDIIRVPANKRGLGIVFQNYALFPHMTAVENVAFGLEMRKVGKADRTRRVAETLALVGLEHVADRVPSAMSGGQQQRVALARALVIEPPILLLDEPLSNLDAKRREEMQVELRRIQQTLGTTTIMVTHDQAEAMALSDRVAVMHDGRVEQLSDPGGAYNTPRTEFVAKFLGRATLLDSPGEEAGAGRLVLRPERVSFSNVNEARAVGVVESAVFQGSRWLFEVKTESGIIAVETVNGAVGVPDLGAKVGVTWRDDDTHRLDEIAQ